uniref:Uncharacterized protein n=1 Tax=Aegilops tauschii subsp. strangulata TaxID=200361 RepID=A0A453KY87_AEGTS
MYVLFPLSAMALQPLPPFLTALHLMICLWTFNACAVKLTLKPWFLCLTLPHWGGPLRSA